MFRFHILLVAGIAFLAFGGVTYAFLDDIAALKEELQAYQVAQTPTNASADLGDLVARLDEMTGPSFNDVAESDWFYRYVNSVAQWGIVSGYSDTAGNPTGVYGPGNPVTIAEMLKMAFKAAKVDEKTCIRPPMLAQAQNHWARPFVSCAEEISMRIFQTATPPDINRPVTRAEVLAITADAFGEPVPPLFSTFKDTVAHRYESDVAYAAGRGIVSGDRSPDGVLTGLFRPDDGINRAEVAKIIYERLKHAVQDQVASGA